MHGDVSLVCNEARSESSPPSPLHASIRSHNNGSACTGTRDCLAEYRTWVVAGKGAEVGINTGYVLIAIELLRSYTPVVHGALQGSHKDVRPRLRTQRVNDRENAINCTTFDKHCIHTHLKEAPFTRTVWNRCRAVEKIVVLRE